MSTLPGHSLEIIDIEGALGVILPVELLNELHVAKGNTLVLAPTSGGYVLARSETNRQMAMARKIMAERHEVLRELSK